MPTSVYESDQEFLMSRYVTRKFLALQNPGDHQKRPLNELIPA
jgi:hypothetical protein